jgi:hypothetical protein
MKREASANAHMHREASICASKGVAASNDVQDGGRTPVISLPGALVFPNLEIVVLNFFAGGLTEASASILSGAASGVVVDGGLIALAIGCLTAVVLFYCHELIRLRRFFLLHANSLWKPSPKIVSRSDMDDPLLRSLSKLSLQPTSLRLRGQLEPPADDLTEPQRTLRQLKRPFSMGWSTHTNAGDQQAKLSVWLSDVAGGTRGIFYQYVRSAITLLVAFVTGWGANSGSETHAIALSLVAANFIVAVYCVLGRAAGDRLEGNVSGCEAALSGVNILLLYLAAQTKPSPQEGLTGNATKIGNSTALATADVKGDGEGELASTLQMVAIVFAGVSMVLPILLTLYDGILVPSIEAYGEATPGERRYGCVILFLRNLLVMPILALSTFMGDGGSLDAVAEVIEDGADSAIETTQGALAQAEPAAEHVVNPLETKAAAEHEVDSLEVLCIEEDEPPRGLDWVISKYPALSRKMMAQEEEPGAALVSQYAAVIVNAWKEASEPSDQPTNHWKEAAAAVVRRNSWTEADGPVDEAIGQTSGELSSDSGSASNSSTAVHDLPSG